MKSAMKSSSAFSPGSKADKQVGVQVWKRADLAPTSQLFSQLRVSPEEVRSPQDFHRLAPMSFFLYLSLSFYIYVII